MRINKASEAVLAKYTPMSKEKIRVEPFQKSNTHHIKSSTLQDFYQEVYAKQSASIEQIYNGKNAQEIELMMMQNRKLIEMKRSHAN